MITPYCPKCLMNDIPNLMTPLAPEAEGPMMTDSGDGSYCSVTVKYEITTAYVCYVCDIQYFTKDTIYKYLDVRIPKGG